MLLHRRFGPIEQDDRPFGRLGSDGRLWRSTRSSFRAAISSFTVSASSFSTSCLPVPVYPLSGQPSRVFDRSELPITQGDDLQAESRSCVLTLNGKVRFRLGRLGSVIDIRRAELGSGKQAKGQRSETREHQDLRAVAQGASTDSHVLRSIHHLATLPAPGITSAGDLRA